LRFIHLADAHLDTAFAGRSDEIRQRLRSASREAFARCVSAAVTENVDALLIAGDLFDGDRLSFETERFLVSQLEVLNEAGVRVVYATGNHDPGRTRSRAGKLEWPSNVTIIPDGKARTVPIVGPAGYPVGYVTGAGHASSRETGDLARELRRPDGSLPQVAILHTQVLTARGSDEHQPYAPSDFDYLRDSGFDYWALGHVHLRQELSTDPPIHYPGNLQGRNPKETGPKGALLVDLRDPANSHVEFLEFAPVRWEKLAVENIGGAETLEHLVRTVTTVWDEARQSDPGEAGMEWMVAVDLGGPSPLWRELSQPEEVETLCREVAQRIGALEVEIRTQGVYPKADIAAHVERQDVLGATLRLIGHLESGAQRLDINPNDLAGFRAEKGLSQDTYIKSLLGGAAEEVLAQMLVKDGGSK